MTYEEFVMATPKEKAEEAKVEEDAKAQAKAEADTEAEATATPDPPTTVPGRLAGLLAITGMVVPVLGLTAALDLTGNVGRIQRNEPVMVIAGLAIVTLAAALWVASGFVSERFRPTKAALAKDPKAVSVKARKRRYGLKIGAAIATLVGTTLVLAGTVMVSADRPAPRIQPSLSNDARHLNALISASQLPTDAFVGFTVSGLTEDGKSTVVYSGFVGPDLEGKVEQEISTFLPAKTYESLLIQAYSSDEGVECNQFAENARLAAKARGDETAPVGKDDEEKGTACLWIPLIDGTGLEKAPPIDREPAGQVEGPQKGQEPAPTGA